MPTYQYACTACDEQLEAVQSFSDAPLTECPACAGRLRKVYSAVGVVFKGSGFYKTDSRAGGKKESSGDSGSGSSSAGSSSTGSTSGSGSSSGGGSGASSSSTSGSTSGGTSSGTSSSTSSSSSSPAAAAS